MSPFDPGLQPERTALAWRRAGLSLGVGSLAAGRLLEPVVHDAWVLSGAGVALAVGLLLGARRRAALVDRALHVDGTLAAGPGGGLLAATAVVAVLVGVAGLLVVVQ